MIGAGASSVTIEGVTYDALTTDVLGNARPNPAGTSPDIGAYESSESVADYNPHKYVATTGSNSNSGVITDPFLTIQYAIEQTQDDDIIHVAAGTYVENIDYSGKNIFIIGEDRETTIIDKGYNTVVLISINNRRLPVFPYDENVFTAVVNIFYVRTGRHMDDIIVLGLFNGVLNG
jgi:hypothetical protein